MNATSSTPLLGMVGRLLWMLVGPLALVLITFDIVAHSNGWLTGVDAAYFGALALMLIGRVLEFAGGNPQTGDGQPATTRHLVRYLLVAGVGGLLVWVLANAIGNHWMAD
jgi:hypothetical protein